MSEGSGELPEVGKWYWISWASEPHRAVVTACGNNLVAFRMDNGINDIRHIDDWKRRSISDADKPKPWWKIW